MMVIRKFASVLFVFVLNFNHYAQTIELNPNNPNIEWGERFRYRGDILRLIDIKGRNFSCVAVARNFLTGLFVNRRKLEVINTGSLSPSYINSFTLTINGKRVSPYHVVEGGNNQLIAIGKRGRAFSRKQKVYYHNFNRQGSDRAVEGDLITSYRAVRLRNLEHFTGIKQSDDFSKSGVHYSIPVGKDDYPGFGYLLFDQFNGLYAQNLEALPFKMNDMDVYDHFLTNEGKYYMIGKEYTGRNMFDRNRSRAGNVLRVRLFSHVDNKLEEVILPVESNFTPQGLQLLDYDDEIIMTGIYSDGGRSDSRGVFFMRMNKQDNEITYKKLTPFSSDFISSGEIAWNRTNLERAIAGRNRPRDLNNLKILELRSTKDGGFIVVAEHQDVQAVPASNKDSKNAQPRFDYNYYFDDLIVYKLDRKGELVWIEKILKSQQSKNDQGANLSTLVAVTDENVHLFFNDSKRNYDDQTGEYSVKSEFPFRGVLGRQNAIGYIKMNIKNGSTTRSMIPGRRSLKAVFNPKKSRFNHRTNELFLYAGLNNRHRLGYVRLR